jgi:radical SAM superfamily enzyme YgiQ (UPF0313 family)
MHIALVNGNRIQPPIAPIGLEYVAEALHAAGHDVEILDLCWADDPDTALSRFFRDSSFGLVGVTLRNTDDCVFTSRESFLEPFADLVRALHAHTDAPIVVGGVGFSVMPEAVLERSGADAGVWGDGEFALAELADRLSKARGRDGGLDEIAEGVPNLIWRRDGRWHRNPPAAGFLAELPPMNRSWVDNRRYFRVGGQAGIETKRGCPGQCIYCADPIAKGGQMRARPPEAIAHELERLLEQGIDHVHICDSEFNLPAEHAEAVCREMVRRNLGERLWWYAYCAPAPFSRKMAHLMRRAGCVGINFGVDSGDGQMLRRLKRGHATDDIRHAARWCKEAGIVTMFDLLLGAPGETRGSIKRTVELMRQAKPDRVGVAVGVRVYPGTALAGMVTQEKLREGLIGGQDSAAPRFFLEPAVAPFVFDLLDQLIGDDRRFFFFDPSRPDRDYNYNANKRLVEAIQAGYRGAYWDILRRIG